MDNYTNELSFDDLGNRSPVVIGKNNQKIKITIGDDDKNSSKENNEYSYEVGINTNENNNINTDEKILETQNFINENKQDDKKQMNFIKAYRETLKDLDENINKK